MADIKRVMKKFKLEIKNRVTKIENSSEREVIIQKIIKKVLKEANYTPEIMKKMLPLLKKKAKIYIKEFENEQAVKKDEKELEKGNNKIKLMKKEGKPRIMKRKIKPPKKQISKVEDEDEDEITDRRLLKYIKDEDNETFLNDNKLNLDKVSEFVKALKTLQDSEDSKKKLFSDKEDVFLQITCFKIPNTPSRQLRFILPRMLVSQGDNILLFVKDTVKGRRNTDKSEEFHRELLRKHNVTMVTEVMSITRLKNEYDQYELKRKLLNSYEVFLVDGRIAGHVAHFLGKIFTKKRKLPIPIKMNAEDLNEEIKKGLRRTAMPLHSTGDCFIVRIGTIDMKNKHIAENLLAVCTQLNKIFPGGWDNIQFARIKTPLSIALPIYVSLKSKNQVDVPDIKPKRPKAYTDVEGELSTLSHHSNVVVSPEGEVIIVSDNDSESVKKRKAEQNEKVKNKKRKVKKVIQIENSKVKNKKVDDENQSKEE